MERKVCRKLNEAGSEDDTSVDESTMVLDDNSSDDYEMDCGSDESTFGITAREAEVDKDRVGDEERTDIGSNQPYP
ncbi:hypothetical protein PoB_007109900 [Plakobranchus ocellatus]|uniref:Uncharacterized protein n=1 Tax=Plakobranchus ocellatus TaxID=259542 RepID=A0AAV4DKN6_9GAST|nr:hypothetical protein PoB_007109900 [Plakobranchus ocellatus]